MKLWRFRGLPLAMLAGLAIQVAKKLPPGIASGMVQGTGVVVAVVCAVLLGTTQPDAPRVRVAGFLLTFAMAALGITALWLARRG